MSDMDEDEPEYIEEEDLHPDDILTSTAAFQAAAAAKASQSSRFPAAEVSGDEDDDEDEEEDDDDEDEGDEGAPGPSGAETPAGEEEARPFDPAAVEGILSGQDESTPIFNQLFGAIDYDEDERDGVVDEDMEELQAQMAFEEGGSRKRRRRKPARRYKGAKALTDEQSRLLGEANMAYTQGQYTEAIRYLHQLIRGAPYAHQAWFTLAMIHEELEDADKALQFYLIAAHLTPKDVELWKRLGDMSTRAGQLEQAIYCFKKAIRLDKNDVDALSSRSGVYQALGLVRQAIDGYVQILNVNPDDTNSIKELAKLYLGQGSAQKAIAIFEEILANDEAEFGNEPGGYRATEAASDDEDQDAEAETEWVGRRVQFEEINMLAELYMEVDEYEVAIDFIKKQTRKLQGRWAESGMWDAADNDDEYADASETAERWLPLELRVKLGICRLWTDDLELARQHFTILRREPPEENPELVYDVADAYIEKKMFDAAVEILDILAANPATNTDQTWTRQATCAKELGDLEKSVQLLEAVLAGRPGDVDAALELAQIYTELGDSEQALRLVNQVEEAARVSADAGRTLNTPRALIEVETGDRRSSAREQTRKIEEEQAQLVNRTNYQRCKLLWGRWNDGEATDADHSDLLRTARKLVQKFQTTKAFYPADRGKRFTGLTRKKKKSKAQSTGAQQALENLVTRLRKGPEENATPATNVTSFQGLSFDEWHEVFVMYAVALCRKLRTEEAQMVLQAGIDANVFYHDEERLQKFKLISISIALQSGNFLKVAEVCRWFCNYKPYKNDPYRLYAACLSGGPDAVSAYAQAAVQKAFQRLVRMLDSKAKKTAAESQDHHSVLLSLYGHILLAARSYSSAISTYMKAYSLADTDPLVNMSLGIAFLHRAMNRQTDNRHLQIVQGFTFLFKYFELKGGNEEACYNIGRAFHQIGLFHLAIPYYEKVLAFEHPPNVESHNREAAYNLCGIYMATGAAPLAHMVMRDYCVV